MKIIKNINIEVLSIGTELLRNKLNTNVLLLSKFFEKLNLKITKSCNIKDSKIDIEKSLIFALQNSDIVITTGGLGPTIDDITKNVVADTIGAKLVFSDTVYDGIIKKLEKRNLNINDGLKKNIKSMAMIIDGSKILDNKYGTAQGLLYNFTWKNQNKTIILLPGPPYEINSIIESDLLNYLKSETWIGINSYSNLYKISKKLEFQIFGLTESSIDIELRNILEETIEQRKIVNIETAILINHGIVYVRFDFVLIGDFTLNNQNIFDSLCLNIQTKMNDIFYDKIISNNDLSIEEIVVNKLIKYRKTISLAESCTGGGIAKTITDIDGSSKCFIGAIVAYSNEVKINYLNINLEIIEKYGAVSKEVAHEMTELILQKLNTDFAISTTGIAGPSGATPNKDVGLVYIGLAEKNKGTEVFECKFFGDREEVRKRTQVFALSKLVLKLNSRYENV